MKFIHFLFSRMLLCCLFFALQVALLCVALVSLNFFPIVHFGSILLALAVFCIIIHRKECPEFKIPWLVLLFLVPLFTVFAYLFFAMPKLTKKQAAAMREIEQKAKPPARDAANKAYFAVDDGDFSVVAVVVNARKDGAKGVELCAADACLA